MLTIWYNLNNHLFMTLYINQVHFYLWIRIRTIHLYSYLRKFEFVLVSDKNIDSKGVGVLPCWTRASQALHQCRRQEVMDRRPCRYKRCPRRIEFRFLLAAWSRCKNVRESCSIFFLFLWRTLMSMNIHSRQPHYLLRTRFCI